MLQLRNFALLGMLLLPATAATASENAQEVRKPAETYQQVCAYCHNLDKAVGPEITMAFPEAAQEARGNYMRTTVRHGRAAMPSFRQSKVSNPELEALIQALVHGELANLAADKE